MGSTCLGGLLQLHFEVGQIFVGGIGFEQRVHLGEGSGELVLLRQRVNSLLRRTYRAGWTFNG
jgi:hypothetical protein